MARVIDPNASDWSDTDLLTVTEARERLVEELVAVETELAELKGTASERDTDTADALLRRLRALQVRLAQ
jgi:hypothetical protein